MRVLALLFAAAAAFSAAADSFPLGTGAIGPVPGERDSVAAAAHANGYVAAWIDHRIGGNDLYVARLNARGELLDREGVHVPGTSRLASTAGPVIASDGKDAVVVWSRGAMQSASITETSVSAARSIGSALPVALEWSGRHYVLLFSRHDGALGAMLLDREGLPASGTLQLTTATDELRQGSIACRDGNCFVAFRRNGLIYGGTIGEALFPRRDQTASYDLRRLFLADAVAVGADAQGFYTVAPARFRITVRRHGGTRPVDRVPRWSRVPVEMIAGEYSVEAPLVYRDLHTVARDGVIYLTSESLLLRITAAGAEAIAPPQPAKPFDRVALVSGPAGLTLFWGDDRARESLDYGTVRHAQIYAAPLAGREWRSGGVLVSSSRARELMPRIARGRDSFLAMWVESRLDNALYGNVLDAAGLPFGQPFLIARDRTMAEALAEFDGERFLVIWKTAEARTNGRGTYTLHGRFVEPHGATGEPFVIAGGAELATSLVWNGSEYVLGTQGGVLRVSRWGQLLGEETLGWPDADAIELAYDADTHEYSGITHKYHSSVIAVGPNWFVDYTAVRATPALEPICCSTRPLGAAWYGTSAAIAAGGGHRLAIVSVVGYSDGALFIAPDWQMLPYERATPVRRLQALWRGGEFVVAAGKTLARHAPDGTVRGTQSLGDDVVESTIAIGGPATMIVALQRGDFLFGAGRAAGSLELQQVEVARVSVPPVP
ncbi:MAG: hypothetical protein M3Q69_02375 [Acidobacteriota bacterium]|nr:hypothetical protein [Acidobacteriota bacterium]